MRSRDVRSEPSATSVLFALVVGFSLGVLSMVALWFFGLFRTLTEWMV